MKFRLSQKPGLHTPKSAASMSTRSHAEPGKAPAMNPDGTPIAIATSSAEPTSLLTLSALRHRAVQEVRPPEIAPQHAHVEGPELLVQGPIESEVGGRGLDLRGRGVGAEDDRDRIAGDQVDEEEDHGDDDEHHGDDGEHTTDEIGGHVLTARGGIRTLPVEPHPPEARTLGLVVEALHGRAQGAQPEEIAVARDGHLLVEELRHLRPELLALV